MLILDANSIVLAAEDDLQHERLVYSSVSCLPHKPIAMSRRRHEPIDMMMDLFGLRALPSIVQKHTSSPYETSVRNNHVQVPIAHARARVRACASARDFYTDC